MASKKKLRKPPVPVTHGDPTIAVKGTRKEFLMKLLSQNTEGTRVDGKPSTALTNQRDRRYEKVLQRHGSGGLDQLGNIMEVTYGKLSHARQLVLVLKRPVDTARYAIYGALSTWRRLDEVDAFMVRHSIRKIDVQQVVDLDTGAIWKLNSSPPPKWVLTRKLWDWKVTD